MSTQQLADALREISQLSHWLCPSYESLFAKAQRLAENALAAYDAALNQQAQEGAPIAWVDPHAFDPAKLAQYAAEGLGAPAVLFNTPVRNCVPLYAAPTDEAETEYYTL